MTGTLQPINGGKNNRAFRLEAEGNAANRPVFVKEYFDDDFPRLDHETRFSLFAWEHGIRCIPQPLGVDLDSNSGYYGWIEGQKIERVTGDLVQQAATLFYALNQHRLSATGLELPTAREACFSVAEHIACVEERVRRLLDPSVPKEVCDWVNSKLLPRFEATALNLQHIDLGSIPWAEQCVSPSDFGFHNAVLTSGETATFFDFEYAGWDDPAKMVCDFFCQVQVPVSIDHWAAFCATALQDFPSTVSERALALLPLYRIKWACIVLNSTLPSGSTRRTFAGHSESITEQLDIAKSLLLL